MGMSKCYSLMKCLLIIFSIIFLMVGGGACGFAAWALYDGSAGAGAGAGDAGAARAALCALAAWGGLLATGALCALAGCARRSASLLAGAFALLALSGVAEGAAAWWGAGHVPRLRAALRGSLAQAVAHDYGALPARSAGLDAIQEGLQCCGESGVRDWQGSAWSRAQGAPSAAPAAVPDDPIDLSVRAPQAFYWVPASCCKSEVDASQCEAGRRVPWGAAGGAELHAAGCGARVLAALGAGARGPLAAGAALGAAHALALLLALALALHAHPAHNYKA